MDKRKQTLLTIYAGVFVAGFLINALLGGVLNPVLLIVVLYFIARTAARNWEMKNPAEEPVTTWTQPEPESAPEEPEQAPAEPEPEEAPVYPEAYEPAPEPAAAGPVCLYCGSVLPDGAKFCENCGAPTGRKD